MRRLALLAVTLVLALVVALASPLPELLASLASAPPPPPLSLGADRRCGGLPEDPWQRTWADLLALWVTAARSVEADSQRAEEMKEESLRLTTGRAQATLAAHLSLRDAERVAPARVEVRVDDVSVTHCPGVAPVWELVWRETSQGERPEWWRAVVAVEELAFSAEIHLAHPEGVLITDFDWGRDPATNDPGAQSTAPGLLTGDTKR